MEPVVGATPKVVKSEQEWRAQLTPQEFAVLRQAGTERPWVGEYTDTKNPRLRVPRLRRRTVPQRHQVRLALRLAVVLSRRWR
ncbi:hypothetical protein GCM10018954_078270 [Kutzneria kofuensis]